MLSSSAVEALAAQRSRFRAFIVARLGDESAADDLLQESLVKVMHSAGELRDDEKLTAWFYQLLRRAAIDHMRSRSATTARDDAWSQHQAVESDPEGRKNVCGCFEALLPDLNRREAALIRRVELEGAAVADVAQELGMTANNASVTLHRARKALRKKLEAFCGSCANGACLDCDCAE